MAVTLLVLMAIPGAGALSFMAWFWWNLRSMH